MGVNIGKLNQPQLYNYQYDQLNRLTKMDTYRGYSTGSNNWNSLVATCAMVLPPMGEPFQWTA